MQACSNEKHEAHLGDLEEYTGYYQGVELKEYEIIVTLARSKGDQIKLAFPLDSRETILLRKELATFPKNQKIGILRVGNRILVRKLAPKGEKHVQT